MVLDQAINSLGKTFKLRSDIGEDLLAAAYLRFKQEGLLPTYYHNYFPEITLRQFLDFHRLPRVEYLGCFLQDQATGRIELAGEGVINQSREYGGDRICEVGLGYFREFQKPRITTEFTEMLLDYVFIERGYAGCYGVSPIQNPTIHRFAKRMGFRVHGPLPFFVGWHGLSSSAYLYEMTAFDWVKGRKV